MSDGTFTAELHPRAADGKLSRSDTRICICNRASTYIANVRMAVRAVRAAGLPLAVQRAAIRAMLPGGEAFAAMQQDCRALENKAAVPTEAQAAAGNYRKDHLTWNGLGIAIETNKGGVRSGTGPDGKKWSVTMPSDYGYIKRTSGADGDHVDVYMGGNPDSKKVFVVDQVDADAGRFDEHKCLLGFNSQAAAVAAYHAAFDDGRGPDRMGAVVEMDVDEFKEWVKHGDTTVAAGE